MSLRNQNWITFGGEPVTGMTPTQVRVSSDTPGLRMNAQQEGFVAHAYKLFCDAVNVSAFPGGYHVQNRIGVDGTEVRMESNSGVHRVFVTIKGVEKELDDWLIYASPRLVNFAVDGDSTGSVVYGYSANDKDGLKQRKARFFGLAGGDTQQAKYDAFKGQPGNCTWFGAAPGLISWWSQAPSGVLSSDGDSLAYTQPNGTGYLVYLDEKEIYGAMANVIAACIWVDGQGARWLRLATSNTNTSTMTFMQMPLANPNDTENTTTVNVPLNFLIRVGRAAFNASGTKLVTVQTVLSGGSKVSVIEYDFGSATGTTILSSSRRSLKDVPGTKMVCHPNDLGRYHTNTRDISITETEPYTTTEVSTTTLGPVSIAGSWEGTWTVTTRMPVGAGYQGDNRVVYEVEHTMQHVGTAESTFTSDGTATDTLVHRFGTVFISQTFSGGAFTHVGSLTSNDVRTERYRVWEYVGEEPEAAVYDSGAVRTYGRTVSKEYDVSYTFPAGNGTQFSDAGSIFRVPAYTSDHETYTRTFSNDTGGVVIAPLACRPEARYIALGKWQWSHDDKTDGRYNQTATVVEVMGGAVISETPTKFSTTSTSGVVITDDTVTDATSTGVYDAYFGNYYRKAGRVYTNTRALGANNVVVASVPTTYSDPEWIAYGQTRYETEYPIPTNYFGQGFLFPVVPHDTTTTTSTTPWPSTITSYYSPPGVAFQPKSEPELAVTSFWMGAYGAPVAYSNRVQGIVGESTRPGDAGEVTTGGVYTAASLALFFFDVPSPAWPAPTFVSQRTMEGYGHTHCKIKFFDGAYKELDTIKTVCLMSVDPDNPGAGPSVTATASTRARLSHPFIPLKKRKVAP